MTPSQGVLRTLENVPTCVRTTNKKIASTSQVTRGRARSPTQCRNTLLHVTHLDFYIASKYTVLKVPKVKVVIMQNGIFQDNACCILGLYLLMHQCVVRLFHMCILSHINIINIWLECIVAITPLLAWDVISICTSLDDIWGNESSAYTLLKQ